MPLSVFPRHRAFDVNGSATAARKGRVLRGSGGDRAHPCSHCVLSSEILGDGQPETASTTNHWFAQAWKNADPALHSRRRLQAQSKEQAAGGLNFGFCQRRILFSKTSLFAATVRSIPPERPEMGIPRFEKDSF